MSILQGNETLTECIVYSVILSVLIIFSLMQPTLQNPLEWSDDVNTHTSQTWESISSLPTIPNDMNAALAIQMYDYFSNFLQSEFHSK